MISCDTACSVTVSSKPQEIAQSSVCLLGASTNLTASARKVDDVVEVQMVANSFEDGGFGEGLNCACHDMMLVVSDVGLALDVR